MIRKYLGSLLKTSITRKELDPNRDMQVEPKLSKGA